MITGSQGIARAEDLANRYINKALEALEALPDHRMKKNLKDVAYFVTKRSF